MPLFKKTLAQKAKKFATTNHPTLNNVAAVAVIGTVAAPALAPVGSFLKAMLGNLKGHASNVASSVGAKFTRASDRAANG